MAKIGQLAIFLICAQTLLHFRAKGSYEKYIKLLVSMMLLILLLEPLMDLLGDGREGRFLDRINVYQEELQGILRNQQLENEEITEILSNITKRVSEEMQIQEQVENIVEQVKEYPVSATLQTEERSEAQVSIEQVERVEVVVEYGEATEEP